MALPLNRTFQGQVGEPFEIADGVRRVTADNPGPMTFVGTNTYLLGFDPVVIVDPGPELEGHHQNILRAIGGAKVGALLVTHTHRDHTGLCSVLRRTTGAPVIGARSHSREASEPALPFGNSEAVDETYLPDQVLADGEVWSDGGVLLEAIATPGHTANHLCFALGGTDFVLSGDHVMGWSSTLVAPPDGSMTDYLQSLSRLLDRSEQTYLPGHGERVTDAKNHVQALHSHRLARESQILDALKQQDLSAAELTHAVYADVPDSLRHAATLSVWAHLSRLEALDQVTLIDGPAGRWRSL